MLLLKIVCLKTLAQKASSPRSPNVLELFLCMSAMFGTTVKVVICSTRDLQ